MLLDTQKPIGPQLRDFRESNGVTTYEMGVFTRMGSSRVSRLESPASSPTFATIMRYEEAVLHAKGMKLACSFS